MQCRVFLTRGLLDQRCLAVSAWAASGFCESGSWDVLAGSERHVVLFLKFSPEPFDTPGGSRYIHRFVKFDEPLPCRRSHPR